MSLLYINSVFNNELTKFVIGLKVSLFLKPLKFPLIGVLYVFGMPFYAVAVGKVPGVYTTWEECQNQTKGYPQAKYKKFNTAADASNFIKGMGSKVTGLSYNSTATSTAPFLIENLKPPQLKAVSKYSSQTMLKQDKISVIAEKLENFMEQTNKKLSEFGKRLDNIETAIFFGNSSENKRTNNSQDELHEKSQSKKKKLSMTIELSDDEETPPSTDMPITRSKYQSTNVTVEEVDAPWGGNNSNSSTKDFIFDTNSYVIVYTDGACSNNGRHGAKAGIGVWFNHNSPFNVAAPVDGNATNNNAEIQAATRAIEQANLAGIKMLNIHTDSQFMINCMTDWIKKWKRNNWVTSNGGPVKNKEQLVILDQAIQSMDAIKWTHIRGHMGIEGNECADALARSGATMY